MTTKNEHVAKDQIRDASTVVLLRRDSDSPRVLMGMRGAKAVFMPSKYVFPGGALDPEDAAGGDHPFDKRLLKEHREEAGPINAQALITCARRELLEETGLHLQPEAEALFVFRAITPPGRSRRFDARFFLYDACNIIGNPDDFTDACDELSHLHWVPIAEARALALPFITEVVMAEITVIAEAAGNGPLQRLENVPFFDNRYLKPKFTQIR